MIVERFSPANRVKYISLDIQIKHLKLFCSNLWGDFKIFLGINYISRGFQGFVQGQFLWQGFPGFPGFAGHPVIWSFNT